jgi:hypothetical protein
MAMAGYIAAKPQFFNSRLTLASADRPPGAERLGQGPFIEII